MGFILGMGRFFWGVMQFFVGLAMLPMAIMVAIPPLGGLVFMVSILFFQEEIHWMSRMSSIHQEALYIMGLVMLVNLFVVTVKRLGVAQFFALASIVFAAASYYQLQYGMSYLHQQTGLFEGLALETVTTGTWIFGSVVLMIAGWIWQSRVVAPQVARV